MTKNILNIWTVYFSTEDFPDQYVARRFESSSKGVFMTADHFADKNLEAVRDWAKQGCIGVGMDPVRMDRAPEDDPMIIETWM